MRKLLLFISLFFLVSCEKGEIIDGVQSIDSPDDMLEMKGCSFGNGYIDIRNDDGGFAFKAKQSGTLCFTWKCLDDYAEYEVYTSRFSILIDESQVYMGLGYGATDVVISVKKGDKITFIYDDDYILRVYFLKITNEKNSNTNNDDNQDFDF